MTKQFKVLIVCSNCKFSYISIKDGFEGIPFPFRVNQKLYYNCKKCTDNNSLFISSIKEIDGLKKYDE